MEVEVSTRVCRAEGYHVFPHFRGMALLGVITGRLLGANAGGIRAGVYGGATTSGRIGALA